MEATQNRLFYKTLFSIAVPIAVQSLITNLLNAIDVFMISSLGTASTSGVGMANKIFFLLNLFLFGTNSGAAILASQYWGKSDNKSIKKVLGLSLMVGVGGSIIFTLGAILIPETLISLLAPGQTELIKEGSRFLRIIGISYIFTAVTFSYSFILRTTHNAVVPMVITVIAILLNTFFNWVLIFGKFGAPAMGVAGSATATVGARIFECIVLIICVYRLDLAVAGKVSELFSVSQDFVKHYFNTVKFVILNEMLWSIGVVGYSFVYGRMGEVATAAITITQTIEQLAFVVFFGLSNACGVMLGNLLGANNLEQAESYSKKILKIVTGTAIVISILVISVASIVAHLFQVDAIVQKYVTYCLIAFALYLPLRVLNMVIIVGVLRSGGDTKASLVIDLAGVWFVGIPAGIIGGLVLKLDIEYVYAMVMLEEVVKLGMCLYRYFSKKWIRNIVNDSPI